MALGTLTARGSGPGTTFAQTTAAITPTANARIYVAVVADQQTAVPSDFTVIDSAGQYTFVQKQSVGNDPGSNPRRKVALFTAAGIPSPVSCQFAATPASGVPTNMGIAVWEVPNGSDDLSNWETAVTTTGGDPSFNLPNAPAAGSYVVAGLFGLGPGSIPAATGFTEFIADFNTRAANTDRPLALCADTTTPGQTITYSTAFGVVLAFAVEIKDVSGGGGAGSGSASITLGALIAASGADLVLKASTSKALGALLGTGTSKLTIRSSGGGALGALQASGGADLLVRASGARTLGALQGAGAAMLRVGASSSITFGALQASATGQGIVTSSGALVGTLGALSGAGSGLLKLRSTGSAVLGPLTTSASASVDLNGQTTALLEPMHGTGVGRLALLALGGGGLGSLIAAATAGVRVPMEAPASRTIITANPSRLSAVTVTERRTIITANPSRTIRAV